MHCPTCGSEAGELLKLDGGFKLRLRESGQPEPIPDSVCGNCFSSFSAKISQGAQLRAKENVKQQQRLGMWRNRMTVLKQARDRMEQKEFAEAAILYEKYIKILELIYETGAAGLTPELFKNKARSKEVALLTSVYWDLVRIYDSAGSYSDRLDRALNKLTQFAPHSGILPHLAKNISSYLRIAKNSEKFSGLQTKFGIRKKGCFIATAAFGDENALEVIKLREFRDEVLEKTWLGRRFITFYYRVSPHFIKPVQNSRITAQLIRWSLRKFLKLT